MYTYNPDWLIESDTSNVIHLGYPAETLAEGMNDIESPIFDALAAEYFASDASVG